MKVKKFFRDNYFRITNLSAVALILYSPTSNSGKVIKYLLFIIVFLINAISLYLSLKKEKDTKILTRILCISTIVLSIVAIIYTIYRVFKIII